MCIFDVWIKREVKMETKMPIEIIQDDTNKTDYLAVITSMLNERFTTQEQMESRWELNCIEIAQSLGCGVDFVSGSAMFDFSLNSRNDGTVRPIT